MDSVQTLSCMCFLSDQDLFGRRSVLKYSGLSFSFFLPVCNRTILIVLWFIWTEWRLLNCVETSSIQIIAPSILHVATCIEKEPSLFFAWILHGLCHQYYYFFHCSFLSWKLSVAFIPLLSSSSSSQDITGEIRPPSRCSWTSLLWDGSTSSVMSFNVLPACTPPLDYKPQVQEPCLFMCCPSSDFWWHLIIRIIKWAEVRKCSSKRLHLGSKRDNYSLPWTVALTVSRV